MKFFTFSKPKLIICVAFSLLSIASYCQTNTWDGSSNNNWGTAANWSLNAVPTASHDVVININATINVNVSPTINSLTISGNSTVTLACSGTAKTITIDNNGSTIALGSTLSIIGVSTGGGVRSLTIQFLTGGTRTMSIAGTLNVDLVSNDPGVYTSTNSATTVTGIINNNGGNINSAATNLSFNAVGTYNHQTDGNAIPVATWASTSNCNITGVTNTVPTVASFDQSFGNFTWDCTGQSATLSLVGNLTTVNGNLTIGNTNQSAGRILNLATTNNSTYTLNIGGNLVVTNNAWPSITTGDNIAATVNVGGNFNMTATASNTTYFDFHLATGNSITLNKVIMNVAGNFTQSGGYFDLAAGESDIANRFNELRVGGNFSLTGTGVVSTSTSDANVTNGTITFNKAGTQTVFAATPANMAYVNFIVNASSTVQLLSNIELSSIGTAGWAGKFTVNSGGILNAGTNQVLSSTGAGAGANNAFTLSSGAGLMTANVNGVQNGNTGTISTSLANRTFSSSANYTYNGTAIQNSGTFTTTPTANLVNNLTINNTAGNTTTGVTLQQPIAVANILALTAGHATTTSTNILTMNAGSAVSGANYGLRISGGDYDRFVNGPMRKIGNTNFLFPVGKVNRGHHYCGISSPSNVTDIFTAEYISGSAWMLGTVTAAGIDHVSNCEYWNITRSGSSAVNVTLSWNGTSNCNAAVYVSDLATLRAVHFNGTNWNSSGGLVDGGSSPSAGSLTWGGVNSFSPFSLGSTSAATNPLPVKLVNVKAYNTGNSNKIEWTNLTETDVLAYEVERSANGTQFTSMSSVAPKSNANDKEDYYAYDLQASPVTYYRIKVSSNDGKVVYSPIVKVVKGSGQIESVALYPNPVTGKQFTLQMNNSAGNYMLKIYAANGQVIKTETLKHPGGSYSKTIDLPGQLQAGQYYLQITGGEKIVTSKFIVQ